MASICWLKEHGEWATWASKAAARLEELVPHGGHERREVWTAYLSHAIHVAGLDGTLDETAKASLLDRVGRCQASLGQYSAAEKTHRQVLAYREKSLGKEHSGTLISMDEVGFALSTQGKYEKAEAVHMLALATCEKVLGKEHPDTLTSMNNLALVLNRPGKYEEAEAMHRQTLAEYVKVLGKKHPEAMHRQTLATRAKVLGKEHPSTEVVFVLVLHMLGMSESLVGGNQEV
ncbi:hypothetical protein V2W45_1432501 [Cenococcum geophilum]